MRYINDRWYYTPKEVCKVLDMRRETLNHARIRQSLPFTIIKFMNSYLYHKEEVDEYIKEATIPIKK